MRSLGRAGFQDLKLMASGLSGTTLFVGRTTDDLRPVFVKVVPKATAEARAATELASAQGLLTPDEIVELPGGLSGLVALVTPYQPIGSLRQVVDQQGRLPAPIASKYVSELAKALTEIHARGVVHGDLKPSNVVVREDHTPILIDFGSSSSATALSQDARTGATPPFAAPETVTSQVSPQSDVYSLGAVLFYLLTGHNPDPVARERDWLVTPPAGTTSADVKWWGQAFELTELMMSADPGERPSLTEVTNWLKRIEQSLDELPPWDSGPVPGAYEALLSYEDHLVTLSPENPRAFAGRSSDELPVGVADLSISRAAVEFFVLKNQLYISNISRSRNIVQVTPIDGALEEAFLSPGSAYAVAARESIVTIERRYKIRVRAGLGLLPSLRISDLKGDVTRPQPGHDIELTPVQYKLLLAYCAPIIVDPEASSASHAEVARLLDRSPMTTRNQMQALSRRLGPILGVNPADKDAICVAVLQKGIVSRADLDLYFPDYERTGLTTG
jgi:serine/threonine protein kinase